MITLDQVSKTYRNGKVKALDNVDLHVKEGEFVLVRGPSGSGKTTLLLTIGGMLRPTAGEVIVAGNNLYAMSERERAKFRAENIGFVFQMFHLLPYLSATDNVLLAAGARRQRTRRQRTRRDEATRLLDRLGLVDRERHKPSEMSAGERQRTAIARALLNQPKLILADEPTGNLDPENAAEVIGYLSEYHKNGGTVVVVTHGAVADQYADRIVYLRGGRCESA